MTHEQPTGFDQLFATLPALIGMISLPALPGSDIPARLDAIIDAALADLEALEAGGIGAVLVENDFDRPHLLTVGPEVVAVMTRVTAEVRARARVPVGVQVLLNDWRASLAVAHASGADFVRLDFFVDRVRIAAGVIEPQPAAVTAYRAAIGAERVALFTDLQVKYSTLLEADKSLALSARQAADQGAAAVVVTGSETGTAPTPHDLLAARAGGVPLLIGSGLTAENAAALLPLADGAIVGTALRSGRSAQDRVESQRVQRLTEAVAAVAAREQRRRAESVAPSV